jgi:hypothetical protein
MAKWGLILIGVGLLAAGVAVWRMTTANVPANKEPPAIPIEQAQVASPAPGDAGMKVTSFFQTADDLRALAALLKVDMSERDMEALMLKVNPKSAWIGDHDDGNALILSSGDGAVLRIARSAAGRDFGFRIVSWELKEKDTPKK